MSFNLASQCCCDALVREKEKPCRSASGERHCPRGIAAPAASKSGKGGLPGGSSKSRLHIRRSRLSFLPFVSTQQPPVPPQTDKHPPRLIYMYLAESSVPPSCRANIPPQSAAHICDAACAPDLLITTDPFATSLTPFLEHQLGGAEAWRALYHWNNPDVARAGRILKDFHLLHFPQHHTSTPTTPWQCRTGLCGR